MNDIDIVRKFVLEEGPRYRSLLDVVRNACNAVEKELGGAVVRRVYSRADKQGRDLELKDTEKIFAACQRPVTIESLKAIEDIIGVTLVVQYPDQIDRVLGEVTSRLVPQSLVPKRAAKKLEGAYFATHVVFLSSAIEHGGLHCEVQCKTMLHDAWAVKMHDLTYKPQGSVDGRVKQLIESISRTIDGLEQQSQIVRDMILARQAIERRPFQASLDALYAGLSATIEMDWKDDALLAALRPLRERIESEKAHLVECPAADERLKGLAQEIDQAGRDPALLRGAWLLAVRLAGFRGDPDFGRFLQTQVDRVMGQMRTWIADGAFTDREIGAIPLGFYVIRDFTRALEYTDRILELADELDLPVFRRQVLRLNKLTWLLERESLQPSKPDKRAELQASIEKNLLEFGADVDEQLVSTVEDAQGLIQIVFGTSKEQVREGINVCTSALGDGREEEAFVDSAYSEWRTQVGWRRYFDLAEKER